MTNPFLFDTLKVFVIVTTIIYSTNAKIINQDMIVVFLREFISFVKAASSTLIIYNNFFLFFTTK